MSQTNLLLERSGKNSIQHMCLKCFFQLVYLSFLQNFLSIASTAYCKTAYRISNDDGKIKVDQSNIKETVVFLF